MRKFMLVLFIGLVLALNVYGIANEIKAEIEQMEAENEIATDVYME